MRERRAPPNELRGSAERLIRIADRLDAQADATWHAARGYARWGLCDDAEEAAASSRELRVGAIIGRAGAAGMLGVLVGIDDPEI